MNDKEEINLEEFDTLRTEDLPKKQVKKKKKKIKEKTKEEKKALENFTNMELFYKVKEWFDLSKNAREKYDRDWLNRSLFRRGYQFTNQTEDGTVYLKRTSTRIPINFAWAYMRAIVNQVVSYDPKWEITPFYKGARAKQDGRITGKLLNFIFTKSDMSKKIEEATIQGLTYSVGGPFEVYWDEYYDNGKGQPKGQVRIILQDPFDVYFDPSATCIEDCDFITKCVRTSVNEIRNNKSFRENRKMVFGTSEQAESDYKQFLLQTTKNDYSAKDKDTILKETFYKERKGSDVKLKRVVWVEELPEPLLVETIDTEEYPLSLFQADINPLEMYGDSWMKQVMPLNKVINYLESSAFEYNYKVAKGRIIIDKNSGVNMITNSHGSIIEKNRGAEVRALDIPPLPGSSEQQIIRMRSYLQDVSGVQDALLGRVPASVQSGVGIAELKQSSATNQNDLVKRLETCLKDLGKKVLKCVAKHYTEAHIIQVAGKGKAAEYFAVIGKEYLDKSEKDTWKVEGESYPLLALSTNNELDVKIGSWLAYSKEAQQETLFRLAQAGIIGQQDILRYLEFTDIEDIVDNSRAESVIKQKRTEDPRVSMGISQENLAVSENIMLLEGKATPIDHEKDDHELHIAIHQKALERDELGIVKAHIAEHRAAQANLPNILKAQQQQAEFGPQDAQNMQQRIEQPQMGQNGQIEQPEEDISGMDLEGVDLTAF